VGSAMHVVRSLREEGCCCAALRNRITGAPTN
jgi:hypothetical protein